MYSKEQFNQLGWCKFPYDGNVVNWVASIKDEVSKALTDPENADWIRCNGTWFVGVNALNSDGNGKVKGGINLSGNAVEFVKEIYSLSELNLDRGQLSICYPGYPQQSEDEPDASYQYRLNRDAAHIDGLLPEGPDRRRYLREPHAFILGIPLQDITIDTAPLVIWEGSHILAQTVFANVFKDTSPDEWGDKDITEIYHDLRRQIFKNCKKITITAKQGEAYLIHRLALHGMAPWAAKNTINYDRKVIYFRPELCNIREWIY